MTIGVPPCLQEKKKKKKKSVGEDELDIWKDEV